LSTPYNGSNDGYGDNENDGFGDLPRYGSTDHPEDQPGYGRSDQPYSSGYDSAYGSQGYSGAQFGGPGYSEQPYYGANPHDNLVATNGKLQIFNAIGFGFKRTFSNAKLWLLGSVAFIAFTMVLGAIAGALTGSGSEPSQVGPDITGNFLSLISLLLMPFIYRLATKEVDSRATGWSTIGKDVHYWPTIAITIILWLIGLVFSFIFVDQALNGLLADLDSAATNDTAEMEALAAEMGSFFGLISLLMLATLFLTPLYQLMVWYAADGRGGIGQAIVQGFKAGASNYLRLVGFNIVVSIIMMFVIIVTLGLGTIIALPMYLLAQAHAYRQIAGGPVPDDSVKNA